MITWLSQNWLFVIIAGLFLAGMLYGHYRGFLKTALSLSAVIVTAILARVLLPVFSGLVLKLTEVEDAAVVRTNLLLYLGLFAVIFVAIRILLKAADLFTKLPVLHGLNQLAGAVVGIALVLVPVWLFFLIVRIFDDTDWAAKLLQQIEGNAFLQYLFTHNLLIQFLQKLL